MLTGDRPAERPFQRETIRGPQSQDQELKIKTREIGCHLGCIKDLSIQRKGQCNERSSGTQMMRKDTRKLGDGLGGSSEVNV